VLALRAYVHADPLDAVDFLDAASADAVGVLHAFGVAFGAMRLAAIIGSIAVAAIAQSAPVSAGLLAAWVLLFLFWLLPEPEHTIPTLDVRWQLPERERAIPLRDLREVALS